MDQIPHIDLIIGLIIAGSGVLLWLTVPLEKRQRPFVYFGMIAAGVLLALGSTIANLILGK